MSESAESVKSRVSEEEWALRLELAAAYRVFAVLGWTHLIHTHITVEAPGENQFLINPFGLYWDEITASSLVKINADGDILDQGATDLGINPAGFKIHSAIHTSERKAKWVMHIHVPEVVAVANLTQGLIRGLSVYAMDLGPISYHSYEHATNEQTDVCQRMVSDFGATNKVLLLKNHGSITVGDTLHEAFFLTYQLIEACRVQLLTLSAANSDADYDVVPDPIVARTYEIVQAQYTGEDFGKLEWEAARRKMEAQAGTDYRL
jgi:ribulose-5-phosphate 4-epimerase/fuculose-1-phosphate aldolase